MLFESQIEDFISMLPWVKARRQQDVLRGVVEQERRMLPPEEREKQSALVVERIESLKDFQNARTVMLYYPIHGEVDLRPLLDKYQGQKTFLFPVTHRYAMEMRPYAGEEQMKKGRFGVPEPQTAPYKGTVDLILVPGVAFDKHHNRIGRGGGYYDKFLSKHPLVKKIGVCYDFQVRKHTIPHTLWDKKVDLIVTPLRTIE